jgi:HTH-type transcriptional regulator / antitoxin HipB
VALQRRSRADVAQRAFERGQLAAVVAARRQQLNLSQQELADLAGVSSRFVHSVESGSSDVGLSRLLAVLDTLGLHLSLERGQAGLVAGADLSGEYNLALHKPGNS